jgi:diguanylate cyclase
MYRAKATRTAVALYDEQHDDHSPAKLALTANLRTAVEDGQIVVWYQPVLDIRRDRIVALEALVRWEHPELGLLMPDAFVDMAEHTNLIKPLTQRVLALALAQVAQWRLLGIEVAVAVNISAHVLVEPGFVARVLAALTAAQVPAASLKLEVTESTLMVDPGQARSVLLELNEHGMEISIDDFGTGYSSLAYLADLPVSEVKIDRSFVSRMSVGSSERIIVNSTIDLAHHLGLRAVAEGVEEPARLEELRALGCDAAQGYAISPPLTSQQATAWLLHAQSDEPADRIVSAGA